MAKTSTAAQLFARAGELLFGELWQSAAARRLDMNQRTVQRIAAAAAKGEEYPAARAGLDELETDLRETARQMDAHANLIGDWRAAKRAADPG